MWFKIGQKIVYDWYETKEFILVQTIKDKTFNGGKTHTMINGKYSVTGPLRNATAKEALSEIFI